MELFLIRAILVLVLLVPVSIFGLYVYNGITELSKKSKKQITKEATPQVKEPMKRDLEGLLPIWNKRVRDTEWAIQTYQYNLDIQTIVLNGLDSDSNKAEFDYVTKCKLRFENLVRECQHQLDILRGDAEMVEFNDMKSEIYKREEIAKKQLKKSKK